jgi:RHS repeat-associated protein
MASTSNRLASVSGSVARTYTYSAVGSVLTYSNITVTYNNHGRMKTFKKGGTTATFTYNALDQLVKRVGGTPGTVHYVYDEAGHLLGEYNSTGALIQETIWLGDTPVATLRPGTPVGVFYVHTDHLNTPRKVTRPSDNKARWTWESDPFGTALPNENPQSLGTFVYNLRFPGQLYDAHTGLNYNYFRDYDAVTGRYIQSDPIGLTGGINTFAYAGENPLSSVDPFGLASWKVVDSFEAGMVAGIGGQYVITTLQSPCNSQGIRYTITVHAAGASSGVGLKCKTCFTAPFKVPFGGEFEDHSAEPDPNAFNGPYLSVVAGASVLGFGGTYGDTVLGRAMSLRSFSPTIGMGNVSAEVSGTIGTSTVVNVKTESCCEE